MATGGWRLPPVPHSTTVDDGVSALQAVKVPASMGLQNGCRSSEEATAHGRAGRDIGEAGPHRSARAERTKGRVVLAVVRRQRADHARSERALLEGPMACADPATGALGVRERLRLRPRAELERGCCIWLGVRRGARVVDIDSGVPRACSRVDRAERIEVRRVEQIDARAAEDRRYHGAGAAPLQASHPRNAPRVRAMSREPRSSTRPRWASVPRCVASRSRARRNDAKASGADEASEGQRVEGAHLAPLAVAAHTRGAGLLGIGLGAPCENESNDSASGDHRCTHRRHNRGCARRGRWPFSGRLRETAPPACVLWLERRSGSQQDHFDGSRRSLGKSQLLREGLAIGRACGDRVLTRFEPNGLAVEERRGHDITVEPISVSGGSSPRSPRRNVSCGTRGLRGSTRRRVASMTSAFPCSCAICRPPRTRSALRRASRSSRGKTPYGNGCRAWLSPAPIRGISRARQRSRPSSRARRHPRTSVSRSRLQGRPEHAQTRTQARWRRRRERHARRRFARNRN